MRTSCMAMVLPASRGVGELTNRPRFVAVDTPPEPWPAGTAEVDGWGEWSLARPWRAGNGDAGPLRAPVDSILLSVIGYAPRKLGIEGVDPVIDVVVVVVVGFMVVNCSEVRNTVMGVWGYCSDPTKGGVSELPHNIILSWPHTPHNPTRHHSEAQRIPIEPPVLTVPIHTGSLLTKSCSSERFLASGPWLSVHTARLL